MTDDSEAAFPAEEAFALIGDEIRAEILRVLGEDPHEGLSFSELRERVGTDVDSGQFNYHLQRLVGHFVERTDDGYELRGAGLALYRAIMAGTFNRRVELEPLDAGFDCYHCGTGVEASYEDGSLQLQCPGCEHVYVHTMVPPSAAADGPEALLSRVDRYSRNRVLTATSGVCPVCVAGMELEFLSGEEVWSAGAERLEAFVHRSCENCGRQQYATVGMALLDHPVVVSFFHERGRDLTEVPHWELAWVMTEKHLTVRSRDPWEFELRVPCEGETLELVIDDELTVVERRVV